MVKKNKSNPEFLIDGLLGAVKDFAGKKIFSLYAEAIEQGNEHLIINNLTDNTAKRIIDMINGVAIQRGKPVAFKCITIIKNEKVELHISTKD